MAEWGPFVIMGILPGLFVIGFLVAWLHDVWEARTVRPRKPSKQTLADEIALAEITDNSVTHRLQRLGVDIELVTRYGRWGDVTL